MTNVALINLYNSSFSNIDYLLRNVRETKVKKKKIYLHLLDNDIEKMCDGLGKPQKSQKYSFFS